MSDPYNNQYPPPAGAYPYGAQQQSPPPPAGGYPPYSDSHAAAVPPTQPVVPYGGAYGPPYAGGFQHGQEYGAGVGFSGAHAGAYDPSQQQQQMMGYTGPGGYAPGVQPGMEQAAQRGDAYYQPHQGIATPPMPDYASNNPSSPSHQFPQQGAYHQSPYPADPNGPPPAGAAGAEGERGLGGAIMGGLAGHYAGKKKNHGLLGTIGGALLGSYAQDHLKHGKKR